MSPPEQLDDRVIVVGSGPCGAMAAAQLAQRGVSVTVIDAGPVAPRGAIVRVAGNTVFRWQQPKYVERDRHSGDPGVMWFSSRSLGGLSNYWTAAVPRFAPEDFTDGGRLDQRYVWPIGYDDLAPYYPIAEAALTVTAGEPSTKFPANQARFTTTLPTDWNVVAAAVREQGDNDLLAIPMAKGKPWMLAARGTEFSSYHCVLAPLVATGRISLIRNAQVTSLEWSGTERRVVGVVYVDRESRQRRVERARAVVVAAGAIDTTTILLNSRSSDHPDGLGNSNDLVGRYLHDHPREWWVGVPDKPMTALAHPLYVPRDDFGAADPLMATSLTLGLAHWSHRPRTWARLKSSSFGVQVFGTMIPTPDLGVVVPPGSRDGDQVDVHPTISLAYDDAAIRNITSARQRLVEVMATGGLGVTVPGPFHTITPGSSVHFGGTVRMHSSPEFGPLDAANRLYDAPNVVVCDSSCFTTGPEKNPTLTAMAIAARAADLLADEIGGDHR